MDRNSDSDFEDDQQGNWFLAWHLLQHIWEPLLCHLIDYWWLGRAAAGGGGLLGDRVQGVRQVMGSGGRGNLAGGRGERGEHFCLKKALLLLLPFRNCKGRRGVRERTGGRYKMMMKFLKWIYRVATGSILSIISLKQPFCLIKWSIFLQFLMVLSITTFF